MYSLTQLNVDYYAAATKLSAALGAKYDVNVVFGGSPATDGKTITLPHWPMDDPHMRNALYGLVLHEAGGHIRQTDFDLLRSKLNRLKDVHVNTWKSLENILEDVRIERNILSSLPGSKPYLDAAVAVMLRPSVLKPFPTIFLFGMSFTIGFLSRSDTTFLDSLCLNQNAFTSNSW